MCSERRLYGQHFFAARSATCRKSPRLSARSCCFYRFEFRFQFQCSFVFQPTKLRVAANCNLPTANCEPQRVEAQTHRFATSAETKRKKARQIRATPTRKSVAVCVALAPASGEERRASLLLLCLFVACWLSECCKCCVIRFPVCVACASSGCQLGFVCRSKCAKEQLLRLFETSKRQQTASANSKQQTASGEKSDFRKLLSRFFNLRSSLRFVFAVC